jgi:hypothetical protein
MRIATKISEEAFAMIAELTGNPDAADVFEDNTYAVFTVIDFENLEFNVKFMSEDAIFEEVKRDSTMQILSI